MIWQPLPGTGLRSTVDGNIARYQPRAADATGLRRAAVAACLVHRGGEAHVIVMKRAARGAHPGQWALPGGRVDPGEAPAHAALRELEEEVGIEAHDSDIAGALDDIVTGTGFVITPYVVLPREEVRLRRNPHEVHSIHPVAIGRLLNPALPRWLSRADGSRILQMPIRRGMVIHAPTGAMLWQLREVALLGHAWHPEPHTEPAFVNDPAAATS